MAFQIVYQSAGVPFQHGVGILSALKSWIFKGCSYLKGCCFLVELSDWRWSTDDADRIVSAIDSGCWRFIISMRCQVHLLVCSRMFPHLQNRELLQSTFHLLQSISNPSLAWRSSNVWGDHQRHRILRWATEKICDAAHWAVLGGQGKDSFYTELLDPESNTAIERPSSLNTWQMFTVSMFNTST